jgi:hypothetical protein
MVISQRTDFGYVKRFQSSERYVIGSRSQEKQMMRWDGTQLGAEALATWANEGLHPFDEPFVEYDHTGPGNTLRVVVHTDDGPLAIQPWNLVYRTDDGMGVERPVAAT